MLREHGIAGDIQDVEVPERVVIPSILGAPTQRFILFRLTTIHAGD